MINIVNDGYGHTILYIDGKEIRGVKELEFTCKVGEESVLKLEMCSLDKNIKEVK